MNKYEITWMNVCPPHTEIWTERKCRREFGKDEWEEIKAGYLPHIVAVQINGF